MDMAQNAVLELLEQVLLENIYHANWPKLISIRYIYVSNLAAMGKAICAQGLGDVKINIVNDFLSYI